MPVYEKISKLIHAECECETDAIVALSIAIAEMLLHERTREAPSKAFLAAEFVHLADWCSTNITVGSFQKSERPEAEQFELALDLLEEIKTGETKQ